jgi:hypothetical protein
MRGRSRIGVGKIVAHPVWIAPHAHAAPAHRSTTRTTRVVRPVPGRRTHHDGSAQRALPLDLLRRRLARRARRRSGRSTAGIHGLFGKRIGCAEIKSYSTHWTCLLPQHGPGKKHTRPIALEQWQQEIVDTHPGLFLRGLIHSDGCRMTNWTHRVVAGEPKRYEYPRREPSAISGPMRRTPVGQSTEIAEGSFFSNKSLDILGLCCATLDRLGIAYHRPRWDQVSVARREAVAALDAWVGPRPEVTLLNVYFIRSALG